MNKSHFLSNTLLSAALLLTACAATQTAQNRVNLSDAALTVPDVVDKIDEVEVNEWADFTDWKIQFSATAIAKGYAPELVNAFVAQMQYQAKVVSSDRNQPEFSKMIWRYLDSAVSAERVATGRQKYQQHKALLDELEAKYDVPSQYLVAIWGLESAYGGYTGNTNLPSALATLAYDGRRGAFAQVQLFALLDLLTNGDIGLADLQGSWAGGMGHTQFIPTTYQQYGVDENNDGHRNPWNITDALASTANYLSQSGWQPNLPWGQEVMLPESFDYRYVGQTLNLSAWQQMGVQAVSVFPTQNPNAKLWLPGGHQGPALLLYVNHDVIKVYNNSSSYALAVGLLADAIVNKEGLQQSWPREANPLSNIQIKQLQTILTQLGFNTGSIDGILGSNTRRAFQQWQLVNGQVADGFVSEQSAAMLLQSN